MILQPTRRRSLGIASLNMMLLMPARNRMEECLKRTLVLVALGLSSPAQAQHQASSSLTFAGIDENTVPTQSPEFTCEDITSSIKLCSWRRRSYGNVGVYRSRADYNRDTGKITNLDLSSPSFFDSTALESLTERYGTPEISKEVKGTNKQGGLYTWKMYAWRTFANGATLRLTVNALDDSEMSLSLYFPANLAPREAPKVDF